MVSRIAIAISMLGAGFGAATQAAAAAVDVIAWSLQTTVRIGGGDIADGTTTVMNNLEADYSTALQNSTSFSSISAHWDAAGNFDYLLEAAHTGQGNSEGFSRSTGSVQFIPSVNSILTIDAEYNFMLGNGDREAIMLINAGGGPAPGTTLFNTLQIAIPIVGDSRNGTHSYHASAPMLAGELYGFGYILSVATYGGSPTSLSHANGFFHATIEPVPEPATLIILACLSPWIILRHRPHR